MRIGILKQQIDRATNDSKNISIQGESIYGGQAYRISGFRPVRTLTKSLLDLGLINHDLYTEDIRSIIESDEDAEIIELDTTKYNSLNVFFSQINTILPILYRPIEAFTPKQEEHIINIKLPDDIDSLDGLNSFNKRIQGIFQKLGTNDTNGLLFCGFDSGSEWYQVLIENSDFFKWAVFVFGAALACGNIRKVWYESEIARLTLKTMKKEQKKSIEEKILIDKIIETKIEDEVDSAILAGLPLMNKKKEEAKSQLEMAIKAALKEIDNGAEFHLSLNPPKDISETTENNLTSINYKGIFQIPEQKDELAPKEIPRSIDGNDEDQK